MDRNRAFGVLGAIIFGLKIAEWVLGWAGNMDLIVSRINEPGWIGDVFNFLLYDPPAWFSNGLMFFGVALLLFVSLALQKAQTNQVRGEAESTEDKPETSRISKIPEIVHGLGVFLNEDIYNKPEERERGTWDPEIAGSAVFGKHVYGEQTGNYVKRDDGVWEVYFDISLTSKDPDLSGFLYIHHPFAASDILGCSIGYYSGFKVAHNRPIGIKMLASDSLAYLVTCGDGAKLTADNLTDKSSISGSLKFQGY